MGQCHICIVPELRPAVERVARILTAREYGDAMLYRIETDMLPDGYHGVQSVIVDAGKVSFKRDEDV